MKIDIPVLGVVDTEEIACNIQKANRLRDAMAVRYMARLLEQYKLNRDGGMSTPKPRTLKGKISGLCIDRGAMLVTSVDDFKCGTVDDYGLPVHSSIRKQVKTAFSDEVAVELQIHEGLIVGIRNVSPTDATAPPPPFAEPAKPTTEAVDIDKAHPMGARQLTMLREASDSDVGLLEDVLREIGLYSNGRIAVIDGFRGRLLTCLSACFARIKKLELDLASMRKGGAA